MDIIVTPEKAKQLHSEAVRRMRWRLLFAFAESKYEQFRFRGNKKNPHYQNIDDFCLKHWGKKPGDMTKEELRKHISQVNKWK